jgi:hypothetical protein
MSELTPADLLKSPTGQPRPPSNWASILSVAVALFSLVCAVAVLCITTENQCNDRRDRRILQQPYLALETDMDQGAVFIVNLGPGAAVINDFRQIYKGKTLPNPTVGDSYQQYRTNRLFSGEREWLFGLSSLYILHEAAFLCQGRKVEGCLHVDFAGNLPQPNYMMSSGQRGFHPSHKKISMRSRNVSPKTTSEIGRPCLATQGLMMSTSSSNIVRCLGTLGLVELCRSKQCLLPFPICRHANPDSQRCCPIGECPQCPDAASSANFSIQSRG